MRVLLFSTVVYLAGIATVLFVRPALMFNQEGRWKEFGLRGEDVTVFPFWFFCVGWAAVSYLVAGLLTPDSWTKAASAASLTPDSWTKAASAASLTTAASGLYGSFRGRDDDESAREGRRSSNAMMPLPVSGPTISASKGGGGRGRSRGSRGSKSAVPKGYYLYVGSDAPPSDSSDSEEEES